MTGNTANRSSPTTANTGTSGATTTGGVPPRHQATFINKLYSIIEDAQNHPLIYWSSRGDRFTVTSPSELAKEVLPRYFKHANWQSFVRQLNMYGFHKVSDVFHASSSNNTHVWEFKHPDFKRARPDLLNSIKRRTPKSGAQPPAPASPIDSSPLPRHTPNLQTETPHHPVTASHPQTNTPTAPVDTIHHLTARMADLEQRNGNLMAAYQQLTANYRSVCAAQQQYHRAISKVANFLTMAFSEEESCDPSYLMQSKKKRKLDALNLNTEITHSLSACELPPCPSPNPVNSSWPMSSVDSSSSGISLPPLASICDRRVSQNVRSRTTNPTLYSTLASMPLSHSQAAGPVLSSASIRGTSCYSPALPKNSIPSPVPSLSPRQSGSPSHSPTDRPLHKFSLSAD
ncbi:Flocculation suppression protein [Dispira simplex]|nr:Flocculation suppression protein [Dispira simplex]